MTGTALILFTIFHVLLSLVGILAGLIAITGFLRGRILPTSNRVFLGSTALDLYYWILLPVSGDDPGNYDWHRLFGNPCMLTRSPASRGT